MPATLEEVRNLIQEAFPGSDINGVTEQNYRIIGTIRWHGFNGISSIERNRLVTERVRNRLGLRGVNVGVLFPRTPNEGP